MNRNEAILACVTELYQQYALDTAATDQNSREEFSAYLTADRIIDWLDSMAFDVPASVTAGDVLEYFTHHVAIG